MLKQSCCCRRRTAAALPTALPAALPTALLTALLPRCRRASAAAVSYAGFTLVLPSFIYLNIALGE
jgi:hypothetical protein